MPGDKMGAAPGMAAPQAPQVNPAIASFNSFPAAQSAPTPQQPMTQAASPMGASTQGGSMIPGTLGALQQLGAGQPYNSGNQ